MFLTDLQQHHSLKEFMTKSARFQKGLLGIWSDQTNVDAQVHLSGKKWHGNKQTLQRSVTTLSKQSPQKRLVQQQNTPGYIWIPIRQKLNGFV